MDLAFEKLQNRLTKQPWIVEEHTHKERTLVYIAGMSLYQEELAKVAGIEFYEECLLYVIGLLRNPKTTVVFVTSKQIDPIILDYYFHLFARDKAKRISMEERWHHFYIGNTKRHKTLIQKVLATKRVQKQIESKLTNKRIAVLRCFNVSKDEKTLAVKLDIPLFGIRDKKRPIGAMWSVTTDKKVYYHSFDNIKSAQYVGLTPKQLITMVRAAGLEFDSETNIGIALHLMGALRKHGKFGAVCIAQSPKSAELLYTLLKKVLDMHTAKRITQPVAEEITVSKRRLVDMFVELARISSPSGQEANIRLRLREELVRLGVKVHVDKAGNLIGKKAGRGNVPLLLSAHMDTVQPCDRVRPVVRGNIIMSDGTTVLGADNKAGLVYILEALRVLRVNDIEHRPLEIVFSVREEQFSQGVHQLDMSALKSPFGLVVDGADLGEVDYTAPYIATVDVRITGKAAHSGVEPEKGISAIQIAAHAIQAIKLGRLQEDTTANIGLMSGGTNRNAIPDNVELLGEVRSLSRKKLEEQLERIHKALEDAAEKFGGLLSIDSKVVVPGYTYAKTNQYIKQVMRVMKQVDIQPVLRRAGGASDANIFIAKGIKTIDVGTGVRQPHTVKEQIKIPDMVKMTEFLVEMIKL